jgi:BirA family biotin operon repressor/biotin-[acetyl-CoA-carboxylase] ligase
MSSEFAADHPPLPWDAEALWRQLEPLLPGLAVEVVARAESTSSLLLQRLRGGRSAALQDMVLPGRRASDTQPCLLVAEHQTVGRGRMGRNWQAAPGASLTFSLALALAPADWSGLSLAVGVALAEALDPVPAGRPRIGLKWPNDLWLDERKLGGILIETVSVGPQRMAVVGVGLNVLPMEVGPVSSGYACLSEIDPATSAPRTLHAVALPLVRALHAFERDGFAAFRAGFEARDVLRGRAVRSGVIEGVAQGVTANGALRVLTPSGEQLVTSSEVSVRLASWGPTTPSGLG